MPCEFSRRQMVRSLLLGSGIFPAVISDLMAAESFSAGAQGPAFPGHRQARDLHLPQRRRVARRFLRPQAEARRIPARGQDRREQSQNARLAVGRQAARPIRHRSHRPVPQHRRVRGRSLHRAQHARRSQRSLSGDAGHPHRLRHLQAPERRLVGHLWNGHGESEPAVLRGARARNALCRQPDLVERFSAGRLFRHAHHQRTRTRARPESPRALARNAEARTEPARPLQPQA